MADNWNNENTSLLTVVTPPSLYLPTNGPKIFLAGSIDNGKAELWQLDAIEYIKNTWSDLDITIYNPRRTEKKFKSEWEEEQRVWGITMLEASNYILMHLVGSGPSPISLLELGIYTTNNKLFLSIDDTYEKKLDIEIHYNFFTTKPIHNTLFDSINAIKLDWNNNYE